MEIKDDNIEIEAKNFSFDYIKKEEVKNVKSSGAFCCVCRHMFKPEMKNMVWFTVAHDKGRDYTTIMPLCIDCVRELRDKAQEFLEKDIPMRDELTIINS